MVPKNPQGRKATGHGRGSTPTRHLAIPVLLVVLVVAMILSLWTSVVDWLVPIAVGLWDVAVITLLVLDWRMILRSNLERTCSRAAPVDPGRVGLMIITVATSIAAIIAATILIARAAPLEDGNSVCPTLWLLALSIPAIASAWAFLHTAFTLHYAHLYYRKEGESGGLEFPRTPQPDDRDFAYLAFMIGIGFQSGDVNVCNRSMRLVALAHGVISFAFTTAILALTINVVFDFLKC